MIILISSAFYEGRSENLKDFVKKNWSITTSKIFNRRLNEAQSVNNLSILLQEGFPGNWHWLGGDRVGQISVTLDGGRRLILEPEGSLSQYKDEHGTINNKLITTLIVVELANYHKK